MDLFNQSANLNLLPFDGEVNYYGKVFSLDQANSYLDILFKTIEWQHDEILIFGKRIITQRKVAWYGDDNFAYTYSNNTKISLNWTKELLELKQKAEEVSGESYNSCLLNLYHQGNEGMGWHSDDEKMIEENSAIASISFGAERKFSLKHKLTKQTLSLMLAHGSLLVMKGEIQHKWLHALPKSTKVKSMRINLTFRKIKV